MQYVRVYADASSMLMRPVSRTSRMSRSPWQRLTSRPPRRPCTCRRSTPPSGMALWPCPLAGMATGTRRRTARYSSTSPGRSRPRSALVRCDASGRGASRCWRTPPVGATGAAMQARATWWQPWCNSPAETGGPAARAGRPMGASSIQSRRNQPKNVVHATRASSNGTIPAQRWARFRPIAAP